MTERRVLVIGTGSSRGGGVTVGHEVTGGGHRKAQWKIFLTWIFNWIEESTI